MARLRDWTVRSYLTGWVAYFRYAKAKWHMRRLDEWLRRKLRCMRLKQRKRGKSVTAFLVSLGVPPERARVPGSSGVGWWRMAGSPAAAEAMTRQWFKDQGSSTSRRGTLPYNTEENRRIRNRTSGGVGGRGA